jgi:hypothetical protein
MVARIVVLRLDLSLAKLAAPAGARERRDDDREDDQGTDDDGDDCKGGHRSSFWIEVPSQLLTTARCAEIQTPGRRRNA